MAPDDFRSLRSLHPSQPDGWAPPSNVAEGGHGLRRHQTFGRSVPELAEELRKSVK